jgi:hypothetical protein
MSNLTRIAILSLLIAGVVPAVAGTAQGATATRVKFEVKNVLAKHSGTFTTSMAGSCRRGKTRDRVLAPARQIGNTMHFHLRKTFTCADGTGAFSAVVTARWVIGTPASHGTWTIVSGTGSYAKLRGSGTLVGDQLPRGRVNDHWVGSVHFS